MLRESDSSISIARKIDRSFAQGLRIFLIFFYFTKEKNSKNNSRTHLYILSKNRQM